LTKRGNDPCRPVVRQPREAVAPPPGRLVRVAWFGLLRHRLGFGFRWHLPGSILSAGSRPAGIGHEPSPVRQAIVGYSTPCTYLNVGYIAGQVLVARPRFRRAVALYRPASIASTRQARQRGIAPRSPLEKADLPTRTRLAVVGARSDERRRDDPRALRQHICARFITPVLSTDNPTSRRRFPTWNATSHRAAPVCDDERRHGRQGNTRHGVRFVADNVAR